MWLCSLLYVSMLSAHQPWIIPKLNRWMHTSVCLLLVYTVHMLWCSLPTTVVYVLNAANAYFTWCIIIGHVVIRCASMLPVLQHVQGCTRHAPRSILLTRCASNLLAKEGLEMYSKHTDRLSQCLHCELDSEAGCGHIWHQQKQSWPQFWPSRQEHHRTHPEAKAEKSNRGPEVHISKPLSNGRQVFGNTAHWQPWQTQCLSASC